MTMGIIDTKAVDEGKVIEDSINDDGVRTLHIMSLGPLDEHWILHAPFIKDGEVQLYTDELKMHHLSVTWAVREPIRGFLRGAEQIEWPMMLWALRKGDHMEAQIKKAAEAHFEAFACWPDYAWARRLPRGIENGVIVNLEFCEVIVLEADWVPRRCLCVGNGRSKPGLRSGE